MKVLNNLICFANSVLIGGSLIYRKKLRKENCIQQVQDLYTLNALWKHNKNT